MTPAAIQQIGSSPRLKVHELGHAVGLCHVREEADAVRGDGGFAGADGGKRLQRARAPAIRAIYASGLEPGATRVDFQRVGLAR